MIWGVLMKARHEDWKVLKTTRVVEQERLNQAKMKQQDNSFWMPARLVEPPTGATSKTSKIGQNVKFSSARPEPSCWTSRADILYTWIESCWWLEALEVWMHFARPEPTYSTGRVNFIYVILSFWLEQCCSSHLGSSPFWSSGSILASFWFVLMAWLMTFHFFEPSVSRWAMYVTKGFSLCSVLMIRSWNETKHQSNKQA